jgi:hypothetical protein
MIVVTGHSHKNEGICFVADTNDHGEALKATVEAWNAEFTDQMKLVIADSGDYLIRAELDAECVKDFEDECPRREGFILYTNQAVAGRITQSMPW